MSSPEDSVELRPICAKFLRRLCALDWTDARNYDLAINTAAIGFAGAVDVITRAVAARLEPQSAGLPEASGA